MTEVTPVKGSDYLLVSATVFLEERALDALTTRGRASVTSNSQGDRVLSLPTVEISGDSVSRQIRLEEVLADATELLTSLGVTPALVESDSASVRLYISLAAIDGQAGVVFDRSILAPWLDLGVALWIDAMQS
jgi:hypothetical protein